MNTPALIPKDLLGSAFQVEGTPYEIIHANPNRVPGRWKVAGEGWFARETPKGRERTALIVGPAETPEQALDLLLLAIKPPPPWRPRILSPLEALRSSANPNRRR